MTRELLLQIAIVRALLDEMERLERASNPQMIADQLVQELERLGCRTLEVAATLVPEPRRSGVYLRTDSSTLPATSKA